VIAPVVVTRVQLRMPPHDPLLQVTPVVQAVAVPQRHPPGPQLSERWRSQAAQTAPPVPHEVKVPGLRQLLLVQQPCEQLVESHTQLLLKQRWPVPHCAEVPQRQVPFPQLFARVRSQV